MFVNKIYFYTFDPWLLAALYDQWITILHAARHGCRLLKHGIRLCNDDEISRERAKQKATWISIVRLMVLLLILESKHSSGATTKKTVIPTYFYTKTGTMPLFFAGGSNSDARNLCFLISVVQP